MAPRPSSGSVWTDAERLSGWFVDQNSKTEPLAWISVQRFENVWR